MLMKKKTLFLTLVLLTFFSLLPYSLLSQDKALTGVETQNFVTLSKESSILLDEQKIEGEPSFTLLKSQDYNYLASYYAEEYGVDPHLIKAIIKTESRGKLNSVSPKGASGLMQLMPRTAKLLGVKNIFDPGENIKAGVRYFKMMLDRFDGNVQLALAAYNVGPAKVKQEVPNIKQTKAFVKKVLKYYYELKNDEINQERLRNSGTI